MPLGQSFRPNITGPFVATLPTTVSPSTPLSGNGSPEGAVPGVVGQTYTDLLTDNLWMKMQGTQSIGWQVVGVAQTASGGGGSCAQVLYGPAGNPNGKIPGTQPALLYLVDGSVWVKSTGGLSNTGWVLLLAGTGGGGAGTVEQFTSGNGSPVGVIDPAAFRFYVQIDSVPPFQLWFSNGSNWGS